MKKIFIISLSLITMALSACTNDKKTTKTDDLIISKYYETSDIYENAIEIFNPLDTEVDLATYSIDIYSNGDTFVTYNIKLDGILAKNEYYVVANDSASNELLLGSANLLSGDLTFNGNDTIALTKDEKIIDVIGDIGSSVSFAVDVTLIRKENATQSNSVFIAYDFIMYLPSQYQYLKNKNYEIKTAEQLLSGPELVDRDLFLPFIDPENSNLGGGGLIKVTVDRYKDGDTTDFIDSNGNVYTMRYNLIDTREIDGTVTAQEWGYPASNYTNNILKSAKDIYIQSVKGSQLKDTYNRFLGYVWVDGKLLSFLILQAGLSNFNFDFSNVTEGDLDQHYKGIPYFSYSYNASMRAEINKWGVNGETDPTWDYDTKRPKNDRSFLPQHRPFDPDLDK